MVMAICWRDRDTTRHGLGCVPSQVLQAVEFSLDNDVVQEGGDGRVLLYEEAVDIGFHNVATMVRRPWHGGRTGRSRDIQEGHSESGKQLLEAVEIGLNDMEVS
ncbi:3-methyl-2-oxobutanoate hydroxymethyltransferase [Sesbania bispinosa]|nr:3-methyl-2-oxobutanoate hydroxymethyltransferase [Sesbania bispinosa]